MGQRLIVELLNDDKLFIPQRKTEGSVGYDLRVDLKRTVDDLIEDGYTTLDTNKIMYNQYYPIQDCNKNEIGSIYEFQGEGLSLELLPGERLIVSTGIKIAIPIGCEGQVRVRSGMAVKYGLEIVNAPGTIDWDYRGEVKLIIKNGTPHTPIIIKHGDRIAQLVINKVETPEILLDSVDNTERAEGGFGSTGK